MGGLRLAATAALALVAAAPTGASVVLEKRLAAGQNPTPLPGAPVAFTLTLRNSGPGPLAGYTLADVLDPCFEPLDSCAGVVCTGGAACGTCTVAPGGLGFFLSGLGLGPPGSATDTLNVSVSATLGTTGGRCSNTVSSFQPGTGQPVSSAAAVGVVAVTLAKLLATGQPAAVRPGDPVSFRVVVRNQTSTRLAGLRLEDAWPASGCLEPLASCAPPGFSCSGGASCGSCAASPGGISVTGLELAPRGTPGDVVTYTLATRAAAVPGDCLNTATMTDPGSGLGLAASARVSIAGGLSLVKELAPGQPPAARPGEPVAFTIRVENLTGIDRMGVLVDDTMDPCLAPVASCQQVACSPSSACGPCAPRATGFVQRLDLGRSGGARSSATLTVTTALDPGAAVGPCANRASATDPGSGLPVASAASVEVVTGPDAGCAVDAAAGAVRFAAPWVYTAPCATGDPRLPGPPIAQAARGASDLPEAWSLPASDLRLVQLECACRDTIRLAKNLATGLVRLGR